MPSEYTIAHDRKLRVRQRVLSHSYKVLDECHYRNKAHKSPLGMRCSTSLTMLHTTTVSPSILTVTFTAENWKGVLWGWRFTKATAKVVPATLLSAPYSQ